MSRRTLVSVLLAALAVAAAWASGLSTSGKAQAGIHCGVERWPIKTLTDAGARRISFVPIPATVHDLVSLNAPRHLGNARIAPLEFHSYRVTASLVAAKLEADSDIHLVIEEGGESMIVEFPNAGCTHGAQHRYAMAMARVAFEDACPDLSSRRFTSLSGSATIAGVGFFDFKHGQRGVAPNGVELHPVFRFRAQRCRAE